MNRRVALSLLGPIRGGPRPWRQYNNPVPFHQSERPAAPELERYDDLGLKYPVTYPVNVTIDSMTWAPKSQNPPRLPFRIDRTEVGDQLPVYVKYKGAGFKAVTQIRRISGDIEAFRSDLEKVVGKDVKVTPGKLQVDGKFARRIKLYLLGLGF